MQECSDKGHEKGLDGDTLLRRTRKEAAKEKRGMFWSLFIWLSILKFSLNVYKCYYFISVCWNDNKVLNKETTSAVES